MEMKIKYLATISIIGLNCLHAMCLCSIFITFLDFVEIVETTLENIVIGITVRNCMICVGSILGTLIYARFNRRIVFAFFIGCEAVITAIMPHVKDFAAHIALNALLGFCGGALETACFVIIAELWREKANPVIQTLTLAMNVAFVITPLIISPFLSVTDESDEIAADCGQNATLLNLTSTSNSTLISVGNKQESQIWLPFIVLAGVMIIGTYLTIVLECYRIKVQDMKKSDALIKDELNEESVAKDVPNSYKIPFLVITCLMIAIIWGYVGIFFQFWITFVMYSQLRLTKARGALMISVFSFSSAAGCFIGVFASMKVRPMIMLSILTAIIASGNFFLFSPSGPEILWWIGGILISVCIGSYYSFQYNLAQDKIGITGTVSSLYIVFAYLLTATGVPIFIASVIECNPEVFVYYNTSSVVALLILLISLAVLNKLKYPKSVETLEDENENVPDMSDMKPRLSMRRVSMAGMPL